MSGAFWTLHSDLPREGPGDAESLNWALDVAKVPRDARILDAACGPGADIETLRARAPGGHVTAIDKHARFITQAGERWHDDPHVTLQVGDMADPGGPFDFIWCAGALYFLGVTEGLQTWRKSLAGDGVIAFSEPAYFTPAPSDAAREFWEGYDAVDTGGTIARCKAAGYAVMATRNLSDAAWENYYEPMAARIAMLRRGDVSPELEQALCDGEREITQWRACRHEVGYVLVVARPA